MDASIPSHPHLPPHVQDGRGGDTQLTTYPITSHALRRGGDDRDRLRVVVVVVQAGLGEERPYFVDRLASRPDLPERAMAGVRMML